MNHDLKLTVSKSINAPASAVWKALTNEAMIKEYFFGTEVETDWQKGNSIVFRGSWQGQEYVDKGTILEIEEQQLLQYDYWSSMSGLEDKPENYATITCRLDSKDGRTKLTIEQQGFQDQDSCDHSAKNWESVLADLKSLVESH